MFFVTSMEIGYWLYVLIVRIAENNRGNAEI